MNCRMVSTKWDLKINYRGENMNQHSYSIFIIIALIIFSIYRRIRRNIGWQQLNSKRLIVRIVLFCVIGLIFFAGGIFHPISLLSDIIGILLGSILAFYSVSLTTFEQRNGRYYYCPNIWIGSLVTIIFIARFIYRFYGIYVAGSINQLQQAQSTGTQNFGYTLGNSWTAGLMLIMFAYYVIYYVVLLKKQKRLMKANNE